MFDFYLRVYLVDETFRLFVFVCVREREGKGRGERESESKSRERERPVLQILISLLM